MQSLLPCMQPTSNRLEYRDDEVCHWRLYLILASFLWCVFHSWHEDTWAVLTVAELRGLACPTRKYRENQSINCSPNKSQLEASRSL